MKHTCYIYGAGGLGMETMDILKTNSLDAEKYVGIYLVDNDDIDSVNGTEVKFRDSSEEGFVTVAIGEPAIRSKVFKRIQASLLKPKSIISDKAFVSTFAKIGEGCVIAPMCSIQSNAVLMDNVAVNTAAIVGHDVVVGESSVISSQVNLGGAVTVGNESYIGMGALIREGVNIGSNTIIGMGSVVHKDIPDGVIAMGNPARVLKNNTDKKVFG